jgi:hypothetical protein
MAYLLTQSYFRNILSIGSEPFQQPGTWLGWQSFEALSPQPQGLHWIAINMTIQMKATSQTKKAPALVKRNKFFCLWLGIEEWFPWKY